MTTRTARTKTKATTKAEPRRLLERRYVLHRTGCSQEDDQLLREERGWSRASGRKDRVHPARAGRLDQDPSPTPDDRHGSDDLHWVDLRSSAEPGDDRSIAAVGLCPGQFAGTRSAARRTAEAVEDDSWVGPITALTWALEIGDLSRFQSVKQAISYCGLCSAERSSADKLVRMPISKQRNKHIQQTLVEAAKLAPRYSHELALVYERERQRGNRNRATLAVARKMVAYMLAVERRKQDFVLTGKFSGTAAA